MLMPSIAGRGGLLSRLDPPLADVERAGPRASAIAIRQVIAAVT